MHGILETHMFPNFPDRIMVLRNKILRKLNSFENPEK